MLRELRVENLGVIENLSVLVGDGMTVLTGETGAGKTLVVEAIELLLGARADAGLVRSGCTEARVEARFDLDAGARERVAALSDLGDAFAEDGDLVLARVVPTGGRSRAYVNGRLVAAGVLAEIGQKLVDLHGQHSHHSLLTPSAQRHALDRYGGESTLAALDSYRSARAEVLAIGSELEALGGDDRERAREVDLLRFQIAEIDGAAIESDDEDAALLREEEVLSSAQIIRAAAAAAHAALEEGALESTGEAAAAVHGVPTLEDVEGRIRMLQDEGAEITRDLRRIAEQAEEDPGRLETVMSRRRVLRDLRRKYGDTLKEVLHFRDESAARLAMLFDAEERAGQLDAQRARAWSSAISAAEALSETRRGAAARLGEALARELHELGMPQARVEVIVRPHSTVETDTGVDGQALLESEAPSPTGGSLPEHGCDQVEFRLAANPGQDPQPLSRVASGGELARTMLAARVLLVEGAPTLVFDEVDAGIGGEAGRAVGRRLGLIARRHQVLCVTHLAQVAAFANAQIAVSKTVIPAGSSGGVSTRATAAPVAGAERAAEIARMLSGQGTETSLQHANELLAAALADLDS